MNIGFLVKTVPPQIEGVGEYAYHVAKALREAGHDVRIYTSVGQKVAADKKSWVFPVISEWRSQAVLNALVSSSHFNADWWCLQYVPQMYGAYGLPQNILELPALLKTKYNARVSVVMHEHGLDWKPGFKDKVLTLLLRNQTKRLLKDVDLVITTCKRYEESLQSFATANRKVVTIPVGANVLPFEHGDERKNELILKHGLKDHQVLGVFGRMSGFRNSVASIRVLAEAKRKGIHAKMLLLGCAESSNPELFAEMMKLAEDQGVARDIVVTGELSQEDLSLYLSLIDVFLFAQVDGVSTRNTTVMSALAHDLPIITYEPVKGNFDGFDVPHMHYAPRQDEEAFVEVAIGVMNQDCQKKGEVARFFQGHFSWHAVSNQYLNAMEFVKTLTTESA